MKTKIQKIYLRTSPRYNSNMSINKCVDALRSVGITGKAGRTDQETATAVCLAASYDVDYNPATGVTPTLVGKMLTSKMSDLSKAVQGGINHFLSVDNGAYHAELWSQGDNWYAATMASKSQRDGIWLIPGVIKGMPVQDVVPVFVKALSKGALGGADVKKSGGCGCGG